MKLHSVIAGVFFAATSVALTAPAQAVEVDFSGSNVNMGVVAPDQFGVITNIFNTLFSLPPNVAGSGVAYGFIPANTKITFSYSLDGLVNGELMSSGSYDYTSGGNHYLGDSLSDTASTTTAQGTTNGSASTPLVLASANLNVVNPGTSTGVTTLLNKSNSLAAFQTTFFGILRGNPNAVGIIHYNLTSVPLPAALPMFGVVAGGLFAFARRRGTKHAA